MFEIESNKLAQDKGNAPEKKFASQMVTDHAKTDLKGLLSSGKVKAELPTALDSSHQSKLDRLKGEGGKDFSSDFDSMQVSAHKDAVSLFERYAKGGDNADLKNWAGKTLPALKHHLKMAEDLGKKNRPADGTACQNRKPGRSIASGARVARSGGCKDVSKDICTKDFS